MSAFSQVQAQQVLNATLLPGSYSAPTAPIKIRQMSTNGSETSAGTELSGGGFTAGGLAITFNAPTVTSGTFSATIGNQALTIANAPAGTVVGIELVDSSVTPRRLMWGALTNSRTLAAGDTLSYPANSVIASV